jgi:hypothetical protein
VPGRRAPGFSMGAPWLLVSIAVVLGLLVAGTGSSDAVVAHGAATGELTLQLWPAGQGRIDLAQGGVEIGSCDFLVAVDGGPCKISVDAGTPVTATAVPEPDAQLTYVDQQLLPDYPVDNPSFVRWTMAGCAGTNPCTFTPDSDLAWVGAIFTPLELEVGIAGNVSGNGTVIVEGAPPLACDTPAMVHFPDADTGCHGLYPADSSVVLVASPDSQGTSQSIEWGPGCDPDGGDPASARCTVTVDNLRTFAMLAFEGAPVPGIPTDIVPHVHVSRVGHGTVQGSGFDCGSQCDTDPDYQSRVTLDAVADPGSHFVSWQGVCSSNPVCTFSAGSATSVQAVFSVSSSTTTTAFTTTPVTTTTVGKTRMTAFAARVERVRTTRRAGRRLIVLTLVSDRLAQATVGLSRRGRTIVSKTWTLKPGRTALRLEVPRGLTAGRCQLLVRLASADRRRTLTTSVSIGRGGR